jgi:hypothetical protein
MFLDTSILVKSIMGRREYNNLCPYIAVSMLTFEGRQIYKNFPKEKVSL